MRARFQLQMAAYSSDVGRRIREARERNRPGLSQEDAAHEIGVTAKTIGRWERGESQPRGRQWEPLARMLHVAVDDLRGKPPLAPEEELRAQLDRIEANQREMQEQLDQLLTFAHLAATERAEESAERDVPTAPRRTRRAAS